MLHFTAETLSGRKVTCEPCFWYLTDADNIVTMQHSDEEDSEWVIVKKVTVTPIHP